MTIGIGFIAIAKQSLVHDYCRCSRFRIARIESRNVRSILVASNVDCQSRVFVISILIKKSVV